MDRDLASIQPKLPNGTDLLTFKPRSKTTPWRHQLEALWFALSGEGILLHMEMGTGKTKVAIDLVGEIGAKQILVTCPKRVVDVWASELERHAGYDYRALKLNLGNSKKHLLMLNLAGMESAWQARPPTFILINHEAAWREPLGSRLKEIAFDLVVCDECHRIKAPGSKVSRWHAGLWRNSKRRLALSGTPLAHSPLDAYGTFRFLDPGIFGTNFGRFRNRYAETVPSMPYIVKGYRNQDHFAERFGSITYRAEGDVLDLPEVVPDITRYVEMPKESRAAYVDLRDQLVAEVQGSEVTAPNALVHLLRLQQMTSGFVKDDEGFIQVLDVEKQLALTDFLKDLPPGEPVVVFCRFRHDLAGVGDVGEALSITHGEVSGKANDLERFHNGEVSLLACQIRAGSEGIDLTRSAFCVFYSLGFSLHTYLQARKRLHRPGQTRPVRYIHLVSKNSVDEVVLQALKDRRDVIDDILARVKKFGQLEMVA